MRHEFPRPTVPRYRNCFDKTLVLPELVRQRRIRQIKKIKQLSHHSQQLLPLKLITFSNNQLKVLFDNCSCIEGLPILSAYQVQNDCINILI